MNTATLVRHHNRLYLDVRRGLGEHLVFMRVYSKADAILVCMQEDWLPVNFS